MKYVLFYESAPDVIAQAPLYAAGHHAHWASFQAGGTLLLIGPFRDEHPHGAMSVFTTREAAEAFAQGDPFVLNGVVRRWYIREWMEALTPP